MATQQVQITRQEQIILALRDQLEQARGRNTEAVAEGPAQGETRESGQRAPHDLIVARAENEKLRELVSLLQEKLREGGGGSP